MDAYPTLKYLHLVLAAGSVGFFALRWLAVLAGQAWPLRPLARRASAAWDTLLLLAGVGLWVMLNLNPWVHTWLGAKLLWLLAYMATGSLALKRAPTRRGKFVWGLGALACVAALVATALDHTPTPWSRG